jgi:cytochrome P450
MDATQLALWRALPGNSGAPLIGHTLAFFANPGKFAQSRMAQFGPVSRLVFMGQKSVLMVGPEANQFVARDNQKIFSSVLAYEPFMKDFFPGTLGVKDFEDHARHRRILHSAFHRKSLAGYVSTLNGLVPEQIAQFPVNAPFRFFPRVKDLLLEQAARLFMGESLDDQVRVLGKHFLALMGGSSAMIRLRIPGTRFYKGLQSKDALWTFMMSRVAQKRATLTPDLFSHVAHAQSEEGERLTDEEVVGHMLGLMSAAHDTNASAITSMLYALARWPEVQDKVRSEMSALGDTPPDFDALKDLPYTGNVYREALRLWGPSHSLPRVALGDFEIEGNTVPKGTLVIVSPSSTHRLPEYWKDPDRFDPSRFAEPREEHKAHKYAFMPFGGGAHVCIGMILAELQAKVIFWHLLRRFRVSLQTPGADYALKYSPIPTPKDGLCVCLEPITP